MISNLMIGFQEICCHVIFDVKMDFTCKARFVAGGHTTDTPASITYSSVISRNSVRLASFLIAGLNDLDVLAGGVTNAYLNASCRETIWFEGGIETGEDCGKVLIVTRALYGLKSSGATWRADLAATLRDLKLPPHRLTQMSGFEAVGRTMMWCWSMSMISLYSQRNRR